jgi:tetratricopeptide (TPR) repeat protein
MNPKPSSPPSGLQNAGALLEGGNRAQARVICEEILTAQPRHFDALYLLGMIKAQERKFDHAVALLREALAIDPTDAEAHYHTGGVLSEIGEWDAALASYDRAVALRPQFAQAYFKRAMVLKRLNRLDAALDSYARAIAIQPNYSDAHFNLGNLLYSLNRLDAALSSYDSAISHKPTHAGAYCNRGNVLCELGQRESAIASYDRALAINPGDAVASYSRGVALKELNRLGDSLASYNQAIAVNPGFAGAYCNRGVVLKDLNQWDAALADFDQAIALNENLAEAYCNKGNALAALGEVDAAIGNYNKAIALREDFPSAYFSRATTWLLAGDFERGWLAYECRWQRNSGVGVLERKDFQTAPWLGDKSIAGRTILLYGEQGLGDTLQFCRYATLVANLGARVILEVPQPLKTLMASVEGVSQVVAHDEVPGSFEHHCPLMSLPLAFKTTLDNVPSPRRYIHSPIDRAQFWKKKIGLSESKLKVGLVWSGGSRPGQPEAWPALNRRNIPLATLARLRHPNIEFFSLQVGQPAASDVARLITDNWGGPTIIDYTNLLVDFSETAAFVDNLDLVITVDTSTAHLAGGLGKPVWILNRFDTCWRWLLQREDSPWYASVRLYRQKSPGDWNTVVQRIRSDLLQLLT